MAFVWTNSPYTQKSILERDAKSWTEAVFEKLYGRPISLGGIPLREMEVLFVVLYCFQICRRKDE